MMSSLAESTMQWSIFSYKKESESEETSQANWLGQRSKVSGKSIDDPVVIKARGAAT